MDVEPRAGDTNGAVPVGHRVARGRRNALMLVCEGEAHEHPAWHDNCPVCMPYWGLIPACPDDCTKLLASGYCRTCRHYFRQPDAD